MFSYEQVLRQLRYRNWGTSDTSDRKFRVKCSELNGRYTSNEFNLEVSNELSLEVSSEFRSPVLYHFRINSQKGYNAFFMLQIRNILRCVFSTDIKKELIWPLSFMK